MDIRQKDGEHLQKTRNPIFMGVFCQIIQRNIIAMIVNMNGDGFENEQKKMMDKIYKKIVRFLVETHIARIDYESENEVDEFYDWLYSNKFQQREKV
jgi:hypothetical protein